MKAEFFQEQVSSLLSMVAAGQGDEAEQATVLPVASFMDPTVLAREKAMFRRMPLIVGHSSELANAGDYFVREIDQRSWLIVRGDDGLARAFYNYCQHRGTKLVQDEGGECQRRFVCPYHAWTYNSSGRLIGVPRADLFPGLDKSSKGLKQVGLQEAFGLLWLIQDAAEDQAVDAYLGGLADEFAALGLADYHLYFDRTRSLQANWKFPLFAFLESYHLAVLHKQSIGDYFIENMALSEVMDPHIRSFVPRQNVHELADADLESAELNDYVTPTNIVFPNVCMIGHPTSVSILTMWPGERPDQSTWRHMLLTPKKPETDAERAHYDKTIRVLDEMTYEKEDFWVSEQLQQGITAGAIDEMLLSKNEFLIKQFSDFVSQSLASD
ncbi:MAG: aromatic ring-hydroxylating dioxygenase subunit alpha [Pseudomonadota bacterium]